MVRTADNLVNKCPSRCNYTQFILSANCSICFGWSVHPSSAAQITVSTASGTSQPLLLPVGIVEGLRQTYPLHMTTQLSLTIIIIIIIVLKSGILKLLGPSGLVQACNGFVVSFTWILFSFPFQVVTKLSIILKRIIFKTYICRQLSEFEVNNTTNF